MCLPCVQSCFYGVEYFYFNFLIFINYGVFQGFLAQRGYSFFQYNKDRPRPANNIFIKRGQPRQPHKQGTLVAANFMFCLIDFLFLLLLLLFLLLLRPIRLKLQNVFIIYLMNTLDSNEKCLNFGSFDL